jgi:hypothetical protein
MTHSRNVNPECVQTLLDRPQHSQQVARYNVVDDLAAVVQVLEGLVHHGVAYTNIHIVYIHPI